MRSKRVKFQIVVMGILTLFIFPEWAALSAPAMPGGIEPYRFSDQLSSSATWVESRDGAEVLGTWQDNRFRFRGLANNSEVRITKHRREDGEIQTAMRFNTIKNAKRSLEFSEVPPGSEIKLSYGVLSERDKDEQVSYINLRLWIGQKLIKELRVQNNEGWNDVYVPLGIYSFLNRKGIFRVELFSDASKPVLFDFEVEMI